MSPHGLRRRLGPAKSSLTSVPQNGPTFRPARSNCAVSNSRERRTGAHSLRSDTPLSWPMEARDELPWKHQRAGAPVGVKPCFLPSRSGLPPLPRDPGRRPAAAVAAWLAVLVDRRAAACRGPSATARAPFAPDRLPRPRLQRQAPRLRLHPRGPCADDRRPHRRAGIDRVRAGGSQHGRRHRDSRRGGRPSIVSLLVMAEGDIDAGGGAAVSKDNPRTNSSSVASASCSRPKRRQRKRNRTGLARPISGSRASSSLARSTARPSRWSAGRPTRFAPS